MEAHEKDYRKLVLLGILSRHVGREKAIGMGELYEEVFDRPWRNRINDTRALRTLIQELRKEGVAICSACAYAGGGYYLAAAGSEMEDYLSRLRSRALRALALEARLRRITLPELLGQMQLNLAPEEVGTSG